MNSRRVLSGNVSGTLLVVACFAALASRAQGAPTISPIPDQRTFPSLATRPIGFRVADSQFGADAITLAAVSLNTNLVPYQNMAFGGSGSNRNLTIIPAGGTNGAATIIVSAQNPSGATTNEAFTLTVAGFTDIGANLAGVHDASIAWGDYDNDGLLDLLVTGSGTTVIYHNDGNGVFRDIGATNLVGLIASGAVWGDYNNDGRLDILFSGVVAGYFYSETSWNGSVAWGIYRNDGSNTFTQVAYQDFGNEGGGPPRADRQAWGDYDNDGLLDALAFGSVSGLFHNNGTNFSNSGLSIPGAYSGATAWADYDNDGNLDLALADAPGITTTIYHNEGGGTFTVLTNILPGFFEGSMAWEDYNNDGNIDLAMTGTDTNLGYQTWAFAGDGHGSFTNAVPNLPGTFFGTVAWGDFDNDGFPDLVVSTYGLTKIFRNNGDGTFTDMGLSLPGAGGGGVAVGDFNNDGALDIALAGEGRTIVFRNDGAMPNTPPNPPANLSAAPTPRSIELSWAEATDVNQSGGLSYNVRVGTTPGGIDVVGPMADPATGFRSLPALGNAGLRLGRTVTHLRAGTYYWSVQSVDHAFAGSAFAPEQTFTLVQLSITLQPTNQTNILGAPISFTVAAGGTAPFSYQWYFNGGPLADGGRFSGSSTSNLMISGVQGADVGNYTVVVGSACGAVTSTVANIVILTPLVTTQPQSQSALGGATVTFSITATGQQPLAYQWQFNGSNIDGATSRQLVMTNVLVSQSGQYAVTVTNAYGAAGSSNAFLSVAPLALTSQPKNRVAWLSGSALFAVTVAGQPPFTFQWRLNGSNLAGASTNQLVLSNLQPPQFGAYDVVAASGYGSITSSVANLALSEVVVWGQGQTNLAPGLTNVIGIAPFGNLLFSNGSAGILMSGQLSILLGSGAVAVASGAYHEALKTDGTACLLSFGGPLTVSGVSNAVQIANGGTPPLKDLALTANGTVIGQAAIGGLTNMVAIAAGYYHYLALKKDGTVVAWGGNSFGQATVPRALTNVIAIAAGGSHSLALRADGTVLGWGLNSSGQINVPSWLTSVVAIAGGLAHSLALRADGTVVAWGLNDGGQTNVPANLTNVIAIAAGGAESDALVGKGPPLQAAALGSPAIGTNSFSCSLPTQSGRVYALEYKGALSDANWNALPLVAGNGSAVTLRDTTATNSQRFFRVSRW